MLKGFVVRNKNNNIFDCFKKLKFNAEFGEIKV